MPTTPTLTLCDKLVTVIAAAWNPSGDDEVQRVYEIPLKLDTMTGRKVYLFPASYETEPADRGHDQYRHTVVALVVQRYEDAGRPTVAFVDDFVDFVHEQIVSGLDYSRDGPLKWSTRSVLTESAGPVEINDSEQLVQNKVLWAEVPLTFVEII